MIDKSIFPKETFELLTVYQLPVHSRKTQTIYFITISAIVVSFVILPFLHIDVSVKSPGMLRPAIEISFVKIPLTGKIDRVFIATNDHVQSGQVLLTLDSSFISQKVSFLENEITEDKSFKEDLQLLISSYHRNPNIKTPLYRQSYLDYSQKIQDLNIHYNKVKASYDRNRKLHRTKVISDAEFENHRFEYEKALNDIAVLNQSQLSQWQSDLMKYEKEIAEHEVQLIQLKKEIENLMIKAPVSGTIENLASIHPGSHVFANQDIAQISPDTSLIVEVHVNPGDIGLLQKNMPARFQLDAFNYNQWGLATGKILEISSDIHIINDTPVFKVKCALDNDHLELKSGYKGYLKKGMTLQARFIVTERSLWQLLFDKIDDWLNPNLGPGS